MRVFTSRDAATLLSGLTRGASLSSLSAALGFDAPLPLDRAARRRLGIDALPKRVHVAPGPGTLRALLVTTDGPNSAEWMSSTARALVRGAPERAWLLIAADTSHTQLSVAAPPTDLRAAVPLYSIALAQLRESDAETIAALVGCREGPDLMVHLRWRETLGRTASAPGAASGCRAPQTCCPALARARVQPADPLRRHRSLTAARSSHALPSAWT